MATNDGAGAGEEAGQAGSGAPAGGSPEGGSENDDKPITARQLKAALSSQQKRFDETIAAKDRELQAFKEGVGKREPAAPPKVWTRAELKAGVDAGQITQEQSDDIWDRQRETQITAKAREEALAVVTGTVTKERIDQEIESYKRLRPDIMDEGSETREKIRAEFTYLVRTQGMPGQGPDAMKTQHAAIRAVVGPLDKLEKSASAGRSEESEQQGGGDARPGGSAKKGKTLVDQLSARQRAHYQKGIDSRRYKDWSEVEAELKFSPARVGRA